MHTGGATGGRGGVGEFAYSCVQGEGGSKNSQKGAYILNGWPLSSL